jgi:hypothetical protein
MTASIKDEIHELIDVTTDEQLLNAVKVILSSNLPMPSKGNGKKSRPVLSTKVLPNGRTIFVTPGDPSIDATELFGIWKEHPEMLETLRNTAWGGRA